jgi:ABC-2 type transport system ATP-binding protein
MLPPEPNGEEERVAEPCIEIDAVTKRFGGFAAVDGLSFTVPKGIICGFLGPNGAGKTTTLRMMLDIIRPDRGTITVLGKPSTVQQRSRFGYLPEEKGLYKKMTARGVIAYLAALKGVPKREAFRRADRLLDKYGLGDSKRAKIEQLSKGMSQKVQVIATIAHDPELVILDEPFSGLDPVNQQILEELILDLKRGGATILFSTHVMQHAERLCDHIILMARGRKVFDGTMPGARDLMPRRIRIRCDAAIPPARFEAFGPMTTAQDGADQDIEITLLDGATPRDLLKVCLDASAGTGGGLSHFAVLEPSLHDVFVHLVGRDAAGVTQTEARP